MRKLGILLLIMVMLGALAGCGNKTTEEPENQTEVAADPEEAINESILQYETAIKNEPTEEAYKALAALCEEAGRTDREYEVLEEMVRLFPTTDNAKMLENVIVRVNEKNEDCKEVAEQIAISLDNQDYEALKAVVNSTGFVDTWLPAIDGTIKKTCYDEPDFRMQVTAMAGSVEIWCLKADGKMTYFSLINQQIVAMTSSYLEEQLSGDTTVYYENAETGEHTTINTTLTNGIAIGDISIDIGGVLYKGNLDENGKTTEEQDNTVKQNGGTVYAYKENSTEFLYVPDMTVDELVIDSTFLGIPEFMKW